MSAMTHGRPLKRSEAEALAVELAWPVIVAKIELVEHGPGYMVRVQSSFGACAVASVRCDFTSGWPASQVGSIVAELNQ